MEQINSKDKSIDFSSRANPLGMPPSVQSALVNALTDGEAAWDPTCQRLRRLIAQRHGTAANQVMVSHNSGEIIALLAAGSGAKGALLPTPCHGSYGRALADAKIAVKTLDLSPSRHFRPAKGELSSALVGCDLLLLGNPSYPAPNLIAPAALLTELDSWLSGGGWLILDESAVDFTYGSVTNSLWSAVRNEPRVAILRSFTDYMALNMLPVSYAVSSSISWISAARQCQREPTLCGLAQSLGGALETLMPFRTATADYITAHMAAFTARLRRISGMKIFPTDTHWVLCRLERSDITAQSFAERLSESGIIIKPCIDGSYFTLSLKDSLQTDKFIKTARKILMPKN